MRPSSLVTGGAGFIGSHITRRCLSLGHQVTVLDNLSGGFRDQVPSAADFVEASIDDRKAIQILFETKRFDYVYHLAAYAAEGLSHFIRCFNYQNNVVGTMNLINASVKYEVKCFVFTSSIAVYGKNQVPMTEDLHPVPEDPYGIAKYSVELDLRAAYEMFGLRHIIFRPHNAYGEYQNLGDPYRNVIGIFMNRIMTGQPLPVFGDGNQMRAFSYVGDISGVIARSVGVPEAINHTFNIGADKPYTINQLAQVVCSAFGVPPNIEYLPPRKEVQHAYATHELATKLLGARSEVSLEDGISRMAAWARKVGPRQGARFDNIEVENNLPGVWRRLV
jgi:UDP-glucose 4-epimerase